MRAEVAAMTAYTLELREAAIKLNQNESPFDLPREWKEAVLARLVEHPWNIYPDFESSLLRGALAEAYGFAPENVLVGNGSNELLAATIGALVGPGTPVVIAKPTFALYEKLVTIAGGLVIPVAIDPATGVLPIDELVNAATPDSVVIVCSPNNPTGGVLPPDGLSRLLDTGATVLLDRAYADFNIPSPGSCGAPLSRSAGEGQREAQGEGLPPLHDRLVTFSTFSKAWGLAALRVGWLTSTAATCREIRKVKLPYSLNILSESIAAVALEKRGWKDANVAAIVAERERVYDSMRNIVDVYPSAANFLLFRAPRELFDELHARGILIRDVKPYLRVSIGTRAQNDAFLSALKELA